MNDREREWKTERCKVREGVKERKKERLNSINYRQREKENE